MILDIYNILKWTDPRFNILKGTDPRFNILEGTDSRYIIFLKRLILDVQYS